MRLFTTGVINELTAALVGSSMASKIRDDAVLHPGWELVEEFTPGGGPRWIVLRCLATESGLPEDFYVVIEVWTSGRVQMSICEEYDDTTHKMKYMPRMLQGGSVTYDAEGRYATDFTLDTSHPSAQQFHHWTPGGTYTNWWIIVGDDTLTVAFNGDVNSFIHLGAYEPLIPTPIDMPLQKIGSSGEGGITRNPAVAGLTVTDAAHSIKGGDGGNFYSGPYLGFPGSLKLNDPLQGGRALAEQGITIYPWSSTYETIGWALGKQKHMRIGEVSSYPAGFAWGDVYDVEGTLWIPHHPQDFRLWNTGVDA